MSEVDELVEKTSQRIIEVDITDEYSVEIDKLLS